MQGLPKYMKEAIIKKLKDSSNIKPKKLFEEIIVNKENKNLFTPTNIKDYMISIQKNIKSRNK